MRYGYSSDAAGVCVYTRRVVKLVYVHAFERSVLSTLMSTINPMPTICERSRMVRKRAEVQPVVRREAAMSRQHAPVEALQEERSPARQRRGRRHQ